MRALVESRPMRHYANSLLRKQNDEWIVHNMNMTNLCQ